MTAPREFTVPVGERIRALRVAQGWSQRALADYALITQGSISNYERGKRDLPLSLAAEFADALGVSIDELALGEKRKRMRGAA